MVLKIGHKSEFAQGSHSCDFRTEILGGTESMLFENLSQKRIRTRGCVVRQFRTRGMGDSCPIGVSADSCPAGAS